MAATGLDADGRGVVRLLDADPDLAQDLSPDDQRVAAAELTAPLERITRRPSSPDWGPRDALGCLGLLVLDGLLLREVELAGTASVELLGQGDLLRPWDLDGEDALPVPAVIHWTVFTEVAIAVVDSSFIARGSRWPSVVARLTGRLVLRARSLALQQAISNIKHVETRLLLLLWHLADRWGRVRADGIVIELPLTHELLAKLVGAARPSVTTALGRLADRQLLVRDGPGIWRLRRAVADELQPIRPWAEGLRA